MQNCTFIFQSTSKKLIYFAAAFLFLSSVMAQKVPWQRRVGREVTIRHRLTYQQMSPRIWPPEPVAPIPADNGRFRSALGTLCGVMPSSRLDLFVETILDASNRFGIDPFLLSALMYHQSGCRPKTPEWETRYGLTRMNIDMHAPHIRGGVYRYFLNEDGNWRAHTLPLKALRLNQWSMQKTRPNIEMSAAILAVFKKQCLDLDDALGGTPHRHFISHWFFGDRVRHTEPEDAVLTARRRLLSYYQHGVAPIPAGHYGDVALSSPVDGTPRLLLDYFGNKRGNKYSVGHQGIDISGLPDEPVRAVADGRVIFAGIDLKGDKPSRQTTPEEAAAIPRATLGNGGLWVALKHNGDFRTCYMHLNRLSVAAGQVVKAGEIIGTLGNSGTVSSGPHLHLEFRVGEGDRVDPAVYLREILVTPFE